MERKWYQKTWFVVLMIFIFWPIGLILMFKNPFYTKKSKFIVAGIFTLIITLPFMLSSNNKSDNNPNNVSQAELSEEQAADNKTQVEEKAQKEIEEQNLTAEKRLAEEKAQKEAEEKRLAEEKVQKEAEEKRLAEEKAQKEIKEREAALQKQEKELARKEAELKKQQKEQKAKQEAEAQAAREAESEEGGIFDSVKSFVSGVVSGEVHVCDRNNLSYYCLPSTKKDKKWGIIFKDKGCKQLTTKVLSFVSRSARAGLRSFYSIDVCHWFT